MGVVYSMYDALVSINVPDEKAKAVIDALEREMMDKLATKADVAHVHEILARDIQALRSDLKHGLEALRADMGHGLEALRTDMGHGLEKLESRVLIKVGTMMAASLVLTCTVLGTLLAALR